MKQKKIKITLAILLSILFLLACFGCKKDDKQEPNGLGNLTGVWAAKLYEKEFYNVIGNGLIQSYKDNLGLDKDISYPLVAIKDLMDQASFAIEFKEALLLDLYFIYTPIDRNEFIGECKKELIEYFDDEHAQNIAEGIFDELDKTIKLAMGNVNETAYYIENDILVLENIEYLLKLENNILTLNESPGFAYEANSLEIMGDLEFIKQND